MGKTRYWDGFTGSSSATEDSKVSGRTELFDRVCEKITAIRLTWFVGECSNGGKAKALWGSVGRGLEGRQVSSVLSFRRCGSVLVLFLHGNLEISAIH